MFDSNNTNIYDIIKVKIIDVNTNKSSEKILFDLKI